MNTLHEAARNGSLEDILFLLQQGEDLEAFDEAGPARFTPLKYAAKFGHLEIVSALLERCADPNRALPEHYPPLFSAASRGFLKIASLLIQAGADVNATVRNETPLWEATFQALT